MQQRAGGAGDGSRTATASPAAGAGASNGAGAAGQHAAGTAYKPLNVKDALSYLDQVKHQFQRQPQIYNSFLDIMKDFKSQNIDTPGVISRVSSLFRGHPSLIQGFNTFLPEGYRIDCSSDPTESGVITVTTPSGVTRRDLNGTTHVQTSNGASASASSLAPPNAPHAPPPQHQHAPARETARPPQPTQERHTASASAAPPRPPGPQALPHRSSGNDSAGAAANKPRTTTSAETSTRQRAPAEFNHAINFVNKIKNRFTSRPDTYKSFLEILQTYQKEQRPIQDVYAQVTILFQDAPDLLDEFKEFLPDTSGQAAANQQTALTAAAAAPQTQPNTMSASAQTQVGSTAPMSRTARNSATTSLFGVNPSSTSQPQPGPAAGYLSSAGGQDRRGQGMMPTNSLDAAASRRPTQQTHQGQPLQQVPAGQPMYDRPMPVNTADYDDDYQPPGGNNAKKRRAPPPAAVEKQKPKRAKHDQSPDEPLSSIAAAQQGYTRGYAPPQPAHTIPPGAMLAPPAQAAVQPIIIPQPLRPHGPRNQLQPLVTVDELSLFDRIKKFIDDKTMYHEFLKLLNLYTQEIIDMPTLLEKAFLFIGSSDELFGLFREFVGEQDGFVEGEEWPIDNAPALERERFELFSLKSYGPSYRKLPYSESKGLACSGRDALCWSVLNDDWVAFATWASEGSGAHRKNPYEDALASSEQERHWYDYHLESIRRSIAVLEPIVARISLMNAEERSQFKLKQGLGGESSSFYERMIRKIYGRDVGYEAINALYESPAVAAPIILNRLKQKDEEWKRALREWNRVWREVDAKNFYRSLDHQGMTFKNNDKKTTTSKFLLAEIETLRRESQQKRISLSADSSTFPQSPLRPKHQFEMHIDDTAVLFDVLKLAFSFLDRANTPYTSKERTAIEGTLRKLVPLMFCLDEKEIEANLAPAITFDGDAPNGDAPLENGIDSDAEDSAMSDTNPSASDTSALAAPTLKRGKKSVKDLRKKLLTTGINGTPHPDKEGGSSSESESAAAKEKKLASVLDEGSWISASSVPWPSTSAAQDVPMTPTSPKKRNPMQSPERGASRSDPVQELNKEGEARYNFFASQPFYCFTRLFHMLYHRLATLKQSAQALFDSDDTSERLNPFAVDLGLAVPIPNIDESGVKRGKNFYEYMLELCERFFDGEIDSSAFEENLRYMWGIRAFPAFTIDKLIASMCKHAHSMNTDQRCQQLIDLLKRDREQPRTTIRHQIVYRHAAEQAVGGDENLFRLEWIPAAKALSIQLLSPDEVTIDDPVMSTDARWQYYVNTFTLNQPTEGLSELVHAPLLSRNRPSSDGEEATTRAAAVVEGKSDLGIRLGHDNFKLSYVKDTEETIYRASTATEDEVQAEQQLRAKKREAWERWLADQAAGDSVETGNIADSSKGETDEKMDES